MSCEFRTAVREVFADALELPPEQRPAFLSRVCGDDASLRAAVERMLADYESAGEYLADPSVEAPEADLPPSEAAGTNIGRYRLVEKIGEGGFGDVYEAEQERPVRRRVALKVIKPGMDARLVVARFESERQALAMMDHPGIARVLDAGSTDSGRPYFVMELVRGEPVTRYCRANGLSVAQRLELFCEVCEAVQHAHQKGVLHRDLKPSNVLVAAGEGWPAVKVIDFGTAKALGDSRTGRTLTTEAGQMIGTPEYMSPEQNLPGGKGVDTRTDIYSLGVLLYESLIGALPFDRGSLGTSDPYEIRRIIRESAPAKPSTRARQLAERDDAPADRRAGAALARRLRGDLDWITMKAMAAEPARRYDSASELAADVRRHLAGEPIVARPPSVAYRLGKFARRNRAGVIAAALVALVLVVAVAGIGWGLLEAQRQRDEAERLAYTSTIAAASSALAAGDAGLAAAQLASAPEHLRGWEWRHLNARLDQSAMVIDAHDAVVSCVALTPDGERIVSGGSDDAVRVWDAATGRLIRSRTVDAGDVKRCSIGPDGRNVLIGRVHATPDARGYSVAMLDLATLRERWRVDNASSGRASFSADGSSVVVALRGERAVARLDTQTGEVLWRHEVRRGRPVLAGMSPGGEVSYVTGGSPGEGAAAMVAPDGRTTLTSEGSVFTSPVLVPSHGLVLWDMWTDGRAMIGDLRRQSTRAVPERPGRERRPLAVSDDGRWMAIAEGRRVLFFDMQNWRTESVLAGHEARVASAAFSQANDALITGDEAGKIRVWSVPPPPSPWVVERWEPWPQYDAAVSPDGETIATAGWSYVRLWDGGSGTIGRIYNLDGLRHADRVAFSPDGRRLAICGRDNPVQVLDAASGDAVMTTDLVGDRPLQWTPDGRRLLYVTGVGDVRVLDAQSGEQLGSMSLPDVPVQMMAAAGGRVAGVAWPHEPRVHRSRRETVTRQAQLAAWDLSGRRLLFRAPLGGRRPSAVAVGNDGRVLAWSDIGGRVELWDIERGRLLWRSTIGPIGVNELAFSHGGERLAVGHVGGVALLDTTDGRRQATLRHKLGAVVGLGFKPRDEALVVSGNDHPLAIFEAVRPDAPTAAERSRQIAGRAIADPLFRKLIDADRVLAALREQPAGRRRDTAIEYADTRGNHVGHLANGAWFATSAGNYANALIYNKAIRGTARDGAPQRGWAIAMLRYRLGEPEAARAELRQYIQWKGENALDPADLALLALIEDTLGRQPQAAQAWRRAASAAGADGEPETEPRTHIWQEAMERFGGI